MPPDAARRGRQLPLRRFMGLLLVAAVIALIEMTGRPAGLDPAVLIPMAVLAGAALDGLVGGGLASAVGGLYLGLYYISAMQSLAPIAGAPSRALVGLAACALAVLVAIWFRDRVAAARERTAAAAGDSGVITGFAARVADERPDAVTTTLVSGTAQLLDADLVVLTVLDPPSGRHIVRAAHGGMGSPLGVEVLPGVGVTGHAIRDRRLVVAGGEDGVVRRLQRRLDGRGTPQSVAAMPALQAGRVVASLTVGRSSGEPFDETERARLAAIMPIVSLAVSGTLAQREIEQGAPRDAVTGLYNRAYLDAALEQLIALRRRTLPGERPPLSMILFDIDGFGLINQRHGRHVGDHVLRAVATLLRQRFRASDIVARIGPDSFVAALSGATPDVAAEAAAHIRRQVRQLKLANSNGEAVAVSISAGHALYQDGDRPDALYREAEAALDAARTSGLDQPVAASSSVA